VSGGVLSLVTATLGAVAAEPRWGGTLAVLVALAAAGVLLTLAFPVRAVLVTARTLDVVESVLLVALVPLTVLALGVIPL
jgi:uncharacterized membrane protein